MKRFLKWLLIHLLWPILREVLIEVLGPVIKAAFEAMRALLQKWQQRDEAEAHTEAEREDIRSKYECRGEDLDEAEGQLLSKVTTIVEEAMRTAEKSRDKLLANAPKMQSLPGTKGT